MKCYGRWDRLHDRRQKKIRTLFPQKLHLRRVWCNSRFFSQTVSDSSKQLVRKHTGEKAIVLTKGPDSLKRTVTKLIYNCAHKIFAKSEKNVTASTLSDSNFHKEKWRKTNKKALKKICMHFLTALAQCTRGSYIFFWCWLKYIYTHICTYMNTYSHT